MDACGLGRSVLGISSDSLLEAHFLQKLCSTQCYNSCPNIVDLYFNLAAASASSIISVYHKFVANTGAGFSPGQVCFFPNYAKHEVKMDVEDWPSSKAPDSLHLDLEASTR
ncbi:hypothetical protein RHSIM_Rhsim03G0186700 [Rhododendron simsii]|uniref:Uncharacterized protein n=1 Tax=Rhododendron simsii TaxID=118357 RepID=A0A834H4P9_RHOSS|nr:hypothetical protein RHSIM_Rhsim03G0186700 [Rhododendron simsii]